MLHCLLSTSPYCDDCCNLWRFFVIPLVLKHTIFLLFNWTLDTMPRDSRSRSARRSRPYEKRRSGRESSRPRRSPRERSSAGHTSRFEAPSGWNETSTHWDTRTEYGLNFPKRVESTQFSRKLGLAGQDITEVKVIDLIQSGLSNWGLRLVANC